MSLEMCKSVKQLLILAHIKYNYVLADKNPSEANLNNGEEAIATPQIVVNTISPKLPAVMESSDSRQPDFPSDQKQLVVETWHYVEDHFNEVL